MNDIKCQAITLSSAWTATDEKVNGAMFVRVALEEPTDLMFKVQECQTKFVILLRNTVPNACAWKSAHPSTTNTMD